MRKSFKFLSSLLAVILIISSFSAVVAAAPYSVTSGSRGKYYDYDLNSSGKLTIDLHSNRALLDYIGDDYLAMVKTIEINISDTDAPNIEPLIIIDAAGCTATSITFVSEKFKSYYSLSIIDAPLLTDLSFPEDTNLQLIHMSNVGITSLGFLDDKDTFYVGLTECENLVGELAFPDTIESVSLDSCYYVTKVSGKNIKELKLYDMGDLQGSNIPSGLNILTWSGYKFSSFNVPNAYRVCLIGAKFETVSFESGRTYINGGMFTSCKSLKEVEIPDGVTKIQYYAFSDCQYLKKVSLPVSLEQITSSAFDGCSSLQDVYYAGSEEQWNKIKVISNQVDLEGEPDGEEYTLSDVFGEATIHFAIQPGWNEKDGKWYYYDENGNPVKSNWVQDGSRWYYFDASGLMATGWQQIGGRWYFFNSSGAMQTGWVSDGGKWYYMNSSGAMQTGWVSDGGKWYYMNSSGVMQTGWIKDGSSWYYMNSSGVMQTGWLLDGGKWYYLDPGSGAMVTGSRTIGGKTYNFDSSGVCLNP